MTTSPTAPHPRFTRTKLFFNSAGLPVCLLTVALIYEAFLLAVVFAPPGSGPWSQFSEEFKVWCFSYDPRTGGMEWGAVWIMLLEPVALSVIAIFLYRRNLRDMFHRNNITKHWRAATGGAVFTITILLGLTEYSRLTANNDTILPFPGERIRTQIEPPDISLNDQRGNPIALENLRGKVTLVTGVYATCSTSCPEILRAVKTLIDSLPEHDREYFNVLALSLNPEYDTSEIMNAVANAYGFPYPGFHYLNGDPDAMREMLTHMQFSPILNPQTGIIDHANLFILIDANGHIAYRFNLDPRHQQWLHEATTQLIHETSNTGLATAKLEP